MAKKKTSKAELKDQQTGPYSTPTTDSPPGPADGGPGEEVRASDRPAEDGPDVIEDSEFKDLLPRPSAEEQAPLEASLKAEGCRDALTFWKDEKGSNLLLDGYTRLPLCRKNEIRFRTVPVELRDRNEAKMWILNNQFNRRNMTPDTASYLRGRVYNALKQPHGGSRKAGEPKVQNGHSNRTAAELEKRFGVSSSTVRRDGKFAEAVDRIAEVCGEGERRTILSGKHVLTQQDILELAELDAAVMKEAVQQYLGEGRKFPKNKETSSNAVSASGSLPAKVQQPARGKVLQNPNTPPAAPEQEGAASKNSGPASQPEHPKPQEAKQEGIAEENTSTVLPTAEWADQATITFPKDPTALANALVKMHGYEFALEVSRALSDALKHYRKCNQDDNPAEPDGNS